VCSEPGRPHYSLGRGRDQCYTPRAPGAEARNAPSAQSVGACQLVVVFGGHHGGFIVPGLLATNALPCSAQPSKEVISALCFGGLASGACDELQHRDEFEWGDRQHSSGRQSDEIRVGDCFRTAERAEAGLVDHDLTGAFHAAEGQRVDLLPEQPPALPGSSRLADGRLQGVEVARLVGGYCDADVVGCSSGGA
jgi:hypothetical protein